MKLTTILTTLIAILLITSLVTAEIPQVINYQGNLTESDGTPSDGSLLIKFTIYNAPTGGTIIWNGGFQSVTVTNGLFEVQLGRAPMPVLPNNLFSVDTVRFLGITVGTDSEISPRIRFNSVACAYQSLRSDSSGYSSKSAIAGNANLLDGKDATEFADAAHTHNITTTEISNGTILFEDLNQNSAGINEVIKWDGNVWTTSADATGNDGSTFIRWGNGTAPAGASLIYSGFGYASEPSHPGPLKPIVIQTGDPGGIGQGGEFFPLLTNSNYGLPTGITSSRYVKAAVCFADAPTVIIWGSHTPPTGWQIVYKGYALGPLYNNNSPAGPICVDSDNFDASHNYDYSTASLIYGMKIGHPAPGDDGLTDNFVKCMVCKKE